MSRGHRSLVHPDDAPALLIADTAWALPWRATPDQVAVYAKDRQAKGFNATLLMTVQPDMRATGPRDRTADEGFDVGFEDLPKGHLTRLNPDYFRRFDVLVEILRAHGIAPVLQPVFFGFGDVPGRRGRYRQRAAADRGRRGNPGLGLLRPADRPALSAERR
jgi:hypothetical protein